MKVVVTDYNPEWEKEFDREAEKLREAFGGGLVAVHHIGSTSVPGLAAKPIIDIMPVVKDIAEADRAAPPSKSSAMRGWGNTVSPAGGISARAGITAPTSCTCLRRAARRK